MLDGRYASYPVSTHVLVPDTDVFSVLFSKMTAPKLVPALPLAALFTYFCTEVTATSNLLLAVFLVTFTLTT